MDLPVSVLIREILGAGQFFGFQILSVNGLHQSLSLYGTWCIPRTWHSSLQE